MRALTGFTLHVVNTLNARLLPPFVRKSAVTLDWRTCCHCKKFGRWESAYMERFVSYTAVVSGAGPPASQHPSSESVFEVRVI